MEELSNKMPSNHFNAIFGWFLFKFSGTLSQQIYRELYHYYQRSYRILLLKVTCQVKGRISSITNTKMEQHLAADRNGKRREKEIKEIYSLMAHFDSCHVQSTTFYVVFHR